MPQTREPARTGCASLGGSPRNRNEPGNTASRPSSSTSPRRRLSSRTASALAPGVATSVGARSRSPKASCRTPKRSSSRLPLITSGPGRRSHIPSSASQSAARAGGRSSTVAATAARPRTSSFASARAVRVFAPCPSSTTLPRTCTRSPRRTRGLALRSQTTNSPSLVAGLPSSAPLGSCMKKPPRPWTKLPVTTPCTVTTRPSCGLRGPLPWTSPMLRGGPGSGTASSTAVPAGWQPSSTRASGYENAARRAALAIARNTGLTSGFRASSGRWPRPVRRSAPGCPRAAA
ncbi:MAG: hypothetical protein KatS3mg126_0773 [Lysobacteraceae bacterium]|nr:MAG: hypothetical protein KatS3mg126_0773 [Xanthomonadaceae bacterium]